MNRISPLFALLPISLLLASGAAYPKSDPQTVLITGANRGIGFEFVKQYAAKDAKVIATITHPSSTPSSA